MPLYLSEADLADMRSIYYWLSCAQVDLKHIDPKQISKPDQRIRFDNIAGCLTNVEMAMQRITSGFNRREDGVSP